MNKKMKWGGTKMTGQKKIKSEMSIIKKMMIALGGGLLLGLFCMMLRQNLISGGNEATWKTINDIFFQDITAKEGIKSIGLFYIVGKIFMNGLQFAIVPLVVVSISLAMCGISSAGKLGSIAGKALLGFFIFYALGVTFAGSIAYFVKSLGFFSVKLAETAVAQGATVDSYNPLTTIINAVPSNIGEVFSTNTKILAVVLIAVVLGLGMHNLSLIHI